MCYSNVHQNFLSVTYGLSYKHKLEASTDVEPLTDIGIPCLQ